MENCESFKGFGYIYIYIYIDQLVIYASKSFLGLLRKAETMGEIKEFLFAGTVLD